MIVRITMTAADITVIALLCVLPPPKYSCITQYTTSCQWHILPEQNPFAFSTDPPRSKIKSNIIFNHTYSDYSSSL